MANSCLSANAQFDLLSTHPVQSPLRSLYPFIVSGLPVSIPGVPNGFSLPALTCILLRLNSYTDILIEQNPTYCHVQFRYYSFLKFFKGRQLLSSQNGCTVLSDPG